MNKNYIYGGVSFLAGLAIGGIVGGVVAKKVAENKCDKEIDILRDIYLGDSKEDEEPGDILNRALVKDSEEVRERLLKNWDKPNLKSVESELAENEHPMDSDEDESDNVFAEDEKKEIEEASEVDAYYKEHKHDKPIILLDSECEELTAGVEVEEWSYFDGDDTMVDGDDQIVTDFRRFVGNSLDDSGWLDSDDASDINILSHEYMTLYKITKLYKKFSEMDAANHQVYSELSGMYA